MLFMIVCGRDLFFDFIFWKGQFEIFKKLWILVDYIMSYFFFLEEVLLIESRG